MVFPHHFGLPAWRAMSRPHTPLIFFGTLSQMCTRYLLCDALIPHLVSSVLIIL